jgi:hypothetical protein
MSILSHLGLTVQLDLNDLFVGEQLGRGSYREVYACRTDLDLVIKIENHDNKAFCNIHEWAIWEEVRHLPKIARWFAPCIAISANGSVMLQRRTQPIVTMPSRLPNWFADIKPANLGLLDGRVVAHDYGNHHVFDIALKNFKLQTVKELRAA